MLWLLKQQYTFLCFVFKELRGTASARQFKAKRAEMTLEGKKTTKQKISFVL